MRRAEWTAPRNTLIVCLLISSLPLVRSVDESPSLTSELGDYPACRHCGMDRTRYAHSRLLLHYADKLVSPVCSLHCAALDLALNSGRLPRSIQVADYRTRGLIDAESAFWVLGGNQPGVMTGRAKWAFATEQAAEAFVREHGGQQVDYPAALKAAFADMYNDVMMLRQKRSKR